MTQPPWGQQPQHPASGPFPPSGHAPQQPAYPPRPAPAQSGPNAPYRDPSAPQGSGNWGGPPPGPPSSGYPGGAPRQSGNKTPIVIAVVAVVVALIANIGVLLLLPRVWDGFGPDRTPTPTKTIPKKTPAESPSASQTVDVPGQITVDDKIRRGLVLIRVTTPAGRGAGTGMVLTSDGQVLTNYHVVRSTTSIQVTIASTEQVFNAKLIGRDATKDVALLQLEGASGLETVTTDRDGILIGDTVVTAGNAGGQGYITAYQGHITSTEHNIRVRGHSEDDPSTELSGLVETTAHAAPGDSGGAMFDKERQVIAMTTAGGTSDGITRSYGVPIATALNVVDQIRRNDESGTVVIGPRPLLGVTAASTTTTNGVPVRSVSSNGPAQKAGIQAGDTIIGFNGKSITDQASLQRALDECNPGDSVEVRWRTKAGHTRTKRITLGTSPLN